MSAANTDKEKNMTLEELLRVTVDVYSPVQKKNVEVLPDHIVSVQSFKDGGVHFIIHPNGYDGETLDFIVKGNILETLN